MNTIKIKNVRKVAFHGLAAGATMVIKTSGSGVPLDIQWRRRLSDKDIEILDSEVTKPAAENEKGKKNTQKGGKE